MKIKIEKLRAYLAKLGISEKEFFEALELDTLTILDLYFGGNTLNEECSRKFLNAIGADHAVGLIDWEAMNVREPIGTICANAY